MIWFSRPRARVIVICAANVCRSPMAEGLLSKALEESGLAREVKVASAGTHASQSGRRADPRAVQVCDEIGVDLRRSRARQFRQSDFAGYDHIVTMDRANLDWLQERCPAGLEHRIGLLRAWCPGGEGLEVPDPYYGNIEGFRSVLEMLRDPVDALVEFLVTNHQN